MHPYEAPGLLMLLGSRIVSATVVVHLAASRGTRRAGNEREILTRPDVKRLLSEHEAEVIASSVQKDAGDVPSVSATIAVSDMARATRLASALRDIEGIETAYAKPGEELP
jgi:hypothetical protein